MVEIPEFLSALLDTIRALPASAQSGLTGATLGMALREQGWDFKASGYRSLGDAVRALEQRGLVKTGKTEKGAFAVWTTQPETAVPPPRRSLRKAVWTAFVVARPAGSRYLSRLTAQAHFAPADQGPPGPEWVQVDVIEQEVQRTWGTEFLNAKNLVSPVLHSTLQGERWYAHFPLALEHVSAELRREWNQFRTQRVHEWVSRWCTKMGFPDDLAFEPFPTVEKVAGAVAPNESQQGLRSLLLKAIATLSTDELLNIPITARSLVEVLRPELLAKPQGRDQR